MKSDFDEFGVPEDVLAELQSKWEEKVIASHVAEFDTNPPPPAQHPVYPPHPMHMIPAHYPPPHNPYVAAGPPPPQPPQNGQGSTVKAEPVDSRYILSAPHAPQALPAAYTLPPLAGPSLNGARQPPPHPGAHQGILSFSPNGAAQQRLQPAPAPAALPQAAPRIPQTDGPSDSSDESDSPPPSQPYAPHSSHPSLPQPSASQSQPVDSEAINSDLDDSDTEGEDDQEEGGAGDSDIVFCTYDKVARVKNKWKCILKDGMIHVNGKDYLFAKCTGEFEW
ncbi:hypothetical protein HGRIS_002993 [Hohenbuehelia grisea]|uniref:Uncharacterized protein n=1 Tax=Hohenbuehelia grisea TaxID=104357 RepID=A0ABR3JM53_9AGAR